MNLVWHIVRKDLRKFAGAYGLWIVLLAAKLGLALTMMEAGNPDPEWFKWMANAHTVAVIVESLVGFLIVASWVLADETSGSSVFWVTRPISGWRLLAAKLTGVVIFFVVVPGFVPLVWQMYCAASPSVMWAEISRTWLTQGALAAAAFGLAALTGRSSVFVRTLLLAIALSLLASLYYSTLASAALPVPGTLVATRGMLATALFGLTVAGVAVLQYGWRRSGRAWVVALLGVLAIVGVRSSWPWSLAAGESVTAAGWEGRLQVRFAGLRWGALGSSTKAIKGHRTALAEFSITGDIGEARWKTRPPQIEIEFADGTRFTQECRQRSGGFQLPTVPRATLGLSESIGDSDRETKEHHDLAVREARRPRIPNEARSGEMTCLLHLPDSVAKRLQTESAILRLRLPLTISTPEVLWEVPLVDGGVASGGGVRARILRTETPIFQTRGGQTTVVPDRFIVELVSTGRKAVSPAEFVVLQRSSGSASQPKPESRSFAGSIETAGVYLTGVVYHNGRARRNDAWEVAPENAGPRTLAAIAYREAATLVLTDETPGVTLAK